jgi:hypothetical protein
MICAHTQFNWFTTLTISSQNKLWSIYPYKFENKSNEYIVSEQ